MPNYKTPLNVVQLTGRDKHDKKRYEERTPPPETEAPIGDAPDMRLLTFEEAWAAIVDMCPEGVLRRRDRGMVMEAARLHQEIHNKVILQLMDGQHWTVVDPKTSKLYQSYLAKLGCSPTDCNHVHVAKKKPAKNAFDE